MRSKSILVCAVILFAATSVNAEILYNVIDLGTLGGSTSEAKAINDYGQIVGCASGAGGYQATLFDSTGNGNNKDLGSVSGFAESEAWDISNNGVIVGRARNNMGGDIYAIQFDSGGNGNHIVLGGGTARSVNDNGIIVGGYSSSINSWGGIVYTPNYNTFSSVGIRAVNNDGIIVGSYAFLDNQNACIVDVSGNGNHLDLGTLGFTNEDWDSSWATDINNNGQIVGFSHIGSGKPQATLFDPTGQGDNIGLGGVDGGIQSEATAINDLGQIVGIANVGGENHAALFDITGNGNNYDLNDLIDLSSGWNLRRAVDINNDGWIVGDGFINGETHAYLLTPIPEPSTLLLLGLGGIFLRKRQGKIE